MAMASKLMEMLLFTERVKDIQSRREERIWEHKEKERARKEEAELWKSIEGFVGKGGVAMAKAGVPLTTLGVGKEKEISPRVLEPVERVTLPTEKRRVAGGFGVEKPRMMLRQKPYTRKPLRKPSVKIDTLRGVLGGGLAEMTTPERRRQWHRELAAITGVSPDKMSPQALYAAGTIQDMPAEWPYLGKKDLERARRTKAGLVAKATTTKPAQYEAMMALENRRAKGEKLSPGQTMALEKYKGEQIKLGNLISTYKIEQDAEFNSPIALALRKEITDLMAEHLSKDKSVNNTTKVLLNLQGLDEKAMEKELKHLKENKTDYEAQGVDVNYILINLE